MPATSAVFLVEVIGILFASGFVAGVRTVMAMSVSFCETAESSGLGAGRLRMVGVDVVDRDQGQAQVARFLQQAVERRLVGYWAMDDGGAVAARSEEHTSELQSQSNLVCRLLLEKKNTI